MRFLLLPLLLLAGLVIRLVFGEPTADRYRQWIVRIVINIGMPLLILATMWTRTGAAVDWAWGLYVLSFVIVLLIALLAARLWLAFAHFPLSVPFPNLTYLGIPMLWTLLGPEAVTLAVVFDYLCGTPATFLLAGYLAARSGGQPGMTRTVAVRLLADWAKLPPLWALLVGLVVTPSVIPVDWNGALETAKGALGWSIGPAMILAVGLAIRWRGLGERSLWIAAPLRLIVAPAVAIGVIALARTLGIAQDLPDWKLQAIVLEQAMPTMVLAGIMAIRIDFHPDRVTGAVALSSILSVLTLPAWWWVVARLW